MISRDELVSRVLAATRLGGTRWIGVDGLGGAGKTTLARWLAQRCYADVVSVDDFARDDLRTWDQDRFLRELYRPVERGETATFARASTGADDAGAEQTVSPGRTIIVEGVSATDRRLGIRWDHLVWVDAPVAVRMRRIRERDSSERWVTWEQVWLPSEQDYLASQRPDLRADSVVSGQEPVG